MAVDTGVTKKEETILDKSEVILKLLSELYASLDSHFNRTIKGEGECEQKPRADNILDDILDNQQSAIARLEQLQYYLRDRVINKIE